MTKKQAKKPIQEWRNRIVQTGTRPAGDFMANVKNWRVHPKGQRDALKGVLGEVGWVQGVIVNRTTGAIVDGHARIEEALRLGDETPVPFVEVELSEDEENKILATFDPISAMAGADKAQLDALLHEVETSSAAVSQMLADLATAEGLDYGASGAGESGGAAVDQIPAQWAIVIECQSEQEQVESLGTLTEQGFKCRALIS